MSRCSPRPTSFDTLVSAALRYLEEDVGIQDEEEGHVKLSQEEQNFNDKVQSLFSRESTSRVDDDDDDDYDEYFNFPQEEQLSQEEQRFNDQVKSALLVQSEHILAPLTVSDSDNPSSMQKETQDYTKLYVSIFFRFFLHKLVNLFRLTYF